MRETRDEIAFRKLDSDIHKMLNYSTCAMPEVSGSAIDHLTKVVYHLTKAKLIIEKQRKLQRKVRRHPERFHHI